MSLSSSMEQPMTGKETLVPAFEDGGDHAACGRPAYHAAQSQVDPPVVWHGNISFRSV
jgi:hypothetical protein